MVQNSAQVVNDLSKCSIKEVERPQVDRTCNIPSTRAPIQVPQSIQGECCYPIAQICIPLYFLTCEDCIYAFIFSMIWYLQESTPIAKSITEDMDNNLTTQPCLLRLCIYL